MLSVNQMCKNVLLIVNGFDNGIGTVMLSLVKKITETGVEFDLVVSNKNYFTTGRC